MTQLKANATDELGKVIYHRKDPHYRGTRKWRFSQLRWPARCQDFRRPAHRVSAPIRSSSLRPAGRRASKARSGLAARKRK